MIKKTENEHNIFNEEILDKMKFICDNLRKLGKCDFIYCLIGPIHDCVKLEIDHIYKSEESENDQIFIRIIVNNINNICLGYSVSRRGLTIEDINIIYDEIKFKKNNSAKYAPNYEELVRDLKYDLLCNNKYFLKFLTILKDTAMNPPYNITEQFIFDSEDNNLGFDTKIEFSPSSLENNINSEEVINE